MEVFATWFDVREDTADIDNILHFLYSLPGKIWMLTDELNSNFFDQLDNSEAENITSTRFAKAFTEAGEELDKYLRGLNKSFSSFEYQERFDSKLAQVGLTKKCLRLRAAVLNAHWARVEKRVYEREDEMIDFNDIELVTVMWRFLNYFNTILGSLAKVFPAVAAIKEIEEIFTAYLGIATD